MERHFYINESGIKSGPFTIGEMKQKQLDSNSTVMDSIVGEWMPSTKFDFNSISDEDYENKKNSTSSNGSIWCAILSAVWFVFLYVIIYWGVVFLYQKFFVKDATTIRDIMNAHLIIMGIASYCCSPYSLAKGNELFFWIPMGVSVGLALFTSNQTISLFASMISLAEVIFWSVKSGYKS